MRVVCTLVRASSSERHHICFSTKLRSSRFASSAALLSCESSSSFLPAVTPPAGGLNSLDYTPIASRLHSQCPTYASSIKKPPLQRTQRGFRPQMEPGWDQTVENFDEIVRNQALDTISTMQLVKLVQHFAVAAENMIDPIHPSTPSLPQSYGHRMNTALGELKMRKNDPNSPLPYRVLCWSVEAEANCGRPEAIMRLPLRLPPPKKCDASQPSQTTESYIHLRTLRRVLLVHLISSEHSFRPLMLLHRHWAFLEPLFLSPRGTFHHKIEREVESLKPLAFKVARQHQRSVNNLVESPRVLMLALMAHCEPESGLMAMKAYQLLVKHRVELPASLIVLLVRTLVGDGLLEDAQRLVGNNSPIFHSKNPDFRAQEALLALYARKGMLQEAEDIFKVLGTLNPDMYHDRHFTWMMQAASIGGYASEIVRLFKQFFELKKGQGGFCRRATAHHYSIVIQSHAKAGDSEGVAMWTEKLLKSGLPMDAATFNPVLQFYATRGDFKAIHSNLQEMNTRCVKWTATTYTILISAFANRKDAPTIELLGRKAIQEGLQPDTKMIYAMLNAHVQSNSWEGVTRVFEYLESNQQSPIPYSTPCFNHIIKAYVSIGAPFNTVIRTFRRMVSSGLQPSQSSYTSVIRSAAENGRMEAAMKLFHELDERSRDKKSGLKVQASILTIIMGGYLRIRARNKAREILDEILARGLKPDIACITHIIRAYANEQTSESMELAEQVLTDALQSLPEDTNTLGVNALNQLFFPLMRAYAARGNAEKVDEHLKWLIDLGSKPTPPILTIVLDAYRRAGDIESVKKTWKQIVDTVKQDPANNIVMDIANSMLTNQRSPDTILNTPLSIYIDALSTAGLYNEIAAVWKTMKDAGLAFDPDNWNHLTLALIRAGQLERAFQVIEAVIIPSRRHHNAQLLAKVHHEELTPFSLLEEPVSDGPGPVLHSADRRSGATRSAHRTQYRALDHSITNVIKPSVPIRMLRRTSPTMNLWRAHAATLNALQNVLLRLRDGYIIHPHGLSDHHPTHEYNPVEAAQILRRIRTTFPLTVRLLTRPKPRYHKARTRGRRKNPHGWLVCVRFGPQPQWSTARRLQRISMKKSRNKDPSSFRRVKQDNL